MLCIWASDLDFIREEEYLLVEIVPTPKRESVNAMRNDFYGAG